MDKLACPLCRGSIGFHWCPGSSPETAIEAGKRAAQEVLPPQTERELSLLQWAHTEWEADRHVIIKLQEKELAESAAQIAAIRGNQGDG
jgi:hypothetical protein